MVKTLQTTTKNAVTKAAITDLWGEIWSVPSLSSPPEHRDYMLAPNIIKGQLVLQKGNSVTHMACSAPVKRVVMRRKEYLLPNSGVSKYLLYSARELLTV